MIFILRSSAQQVNVETNTLQGEHVWNLDQFLKT